MVCRPLRLCVCHTRCALTARFVENNFLKIDNPEQTLTLGGQALVCFEKKTPPGKRGGVLGKEGPATRSRGTLRGQRSPPCLTPGSMTR